MEPSLTCLLTAMGLLLREQNDAKRNLYATSIAASWGLRPIRRSSPAHHGYFGAGDTDPSTGPFGPVATKRIWASPPEPALVIGPLDRVESPIKRPSLLEFLFYGLAAEITL